MMAKRELCHSLKSRVLVLLAAAVAARTLLGLESDHKALVPMCGGAGAEWRRGARRGPKFVYEPGCPARRLDVGCRFFSPSAAESEPVSQSRKLEVARGVEQALKLYGGTCEKIELPIDEGAILGGWSLSAEPPHDEIKFQLFVEPSLTMKLRAGFAGEMTAGMTALQKLEWANAWSMSKKCSKAFVGPDGDIVVDYDLYLAKLSEPSAPMIAETLRVFAASIVMAALELKEPELAKLQLEMAELMHKMQSVVERRNAKQ